MYFTYIHSIAILPQLRLVKLTVTLETTDNPATTALQSISWIRDTAQTKQIAPAMNVIRLFDTSSTFSEQ